MSETKHIMPSWNTAEATLDQNIEFLSKDDFDSMLPDLSCKGEFYVRTSQTKNPDGTMTVRMKKQNKAEAIAEFCQRL